MEQIPGRKNPTWLTIPFLSIILLATVCLAAPSWLGSAAVEEGVSIVDNPDRSIHGETTLEPEQMWRIGGDDDPSGILLGQTIDVVVDEEDVSFILDATMSTVLVVAPDGTVLRTIGREGDGPGEFRGVMEMEFLPDGSLGVMELMPSKLVTIDREGIPTSNWRLGGEGENVGMSHMRHMEASGGGLVVGMISTRFDEGKVTITDSLDRYGEDGLPTVTFLASSREQSGGAIRLSIGGGDDFAGNFTTLPDGRIVVFQKAHEYKLEIFEPGGSLQRVIRRDYEPVRRADEDIEEAREQAAEMSARYGGSGDDDVEEFERDISQVVARADGELWVLSSRGVRDCPPDHLGIFDVFDADGRYTRTLRLAADYDPENDRFQIVGDRLFVFKQAQNAPDRSYSGGGGNMMVVIAGGNSDEEEEDDEEPMPFEVICYRLP